MLSVMGPTKDHHKDNVLIDCDQTWKHLIPVNALTLSQSDLSCRLKISNGHLLGGQC